MFAGVCKQLFPQHGVRRVLGVGLRAGTPKRGQRAHASLVSIPGGGDGQERRTWI